MGDWSRMSESKETITQESGAEDKPRTDCPDSDTGQASPSLAWEVLLPATLESIPKAIEFIQSGLMQLGYALKEQIKLAVIIDEIVSNIARYAYRTAGGDLTLRLLVDQDVDAIDIYFIDRGEAFNPLDVPMPDVAASTAGSKPGGKGLLIVRRFVDDIEYERANGENILHIRKYMAR